MIYLKLCGFLLSLPLINSGQQVSTGSQNNNVEDMKKGRPDEGGKPLHREKRIIYGQTARIWMFSYQVGIEEKNINICSGCMLSRDWGTSAAVCMVGKNWKIDITARLGTGVRGKGGSEHNISHIDVYPKYNAETLENNLLVFKMFPKANYGRHQEPITIAGSKDFFKEGTILNVSGWGASDESDKYPFYLKHAAMAVVSDSNCSSKYREKYKNTKFQIRKNEMCVSSVVAATCVGDTGAPAVYNNKLVGIVSTSLNIMSNCKISLFPTILMKISEFYNWIKSKTKIMFINS